MVKQKLQKQSHCTENEFEAKYAFRARDSSSGEAVRERSGRMKHESAEPRIARPEAQRRGAPKSPPQNAQ